MKQLFLVLSMLLVVNFGLKASQMTANERKPNKVETKSFSDIKEIKLNHSFGNVDIRKNSSNEVQVEIHYFQGKDKNMPATQIEAKGKTLNIRSIDTGKRDARVDYFISIPEDTDLSINQDYGDISIRDDLKGKFQLNCNYGNLNAKSFSIDHIALSGKYSNFSLQDAQGMTIICSYGNININSVQFISTNSRYSNYTIYSAINASFYLSYGNITIKNAINVDGVLKYSDLLIDELKNAFIGNCSYGNVKIKKSGNELKMIKFTGKYSDINLALDTLDTFPTTSFKLKTKYGIINLPESFNQNARTLESDKISIYKEGVWGNGKPSTDLNIEVSHGNITIDNK